MNDKNLDLKLISIVIPVYRNAGSLIPTYDEIFQLFSEKLSGSYTFELIFINDGSDDNSLIELKEIHSTDKRVKLINLSKNFGQAAATLAGYSLAKGDAVITISADLQDPISLMEKMVRQLESGNDVVICYREGRDDGFLSSLFSKIAYGFVKFSVPNLPIGGFDYYLLSRRAIDSFSSFGIKSRFFQGDILWMGYPTAMIPYFRKKRLHGKSQYNFSKKFKTFLDIFLDSSYLPIRLISSVGAVIALMGFFFSGSTILTWYLNKTPFNGWAPIIISILIVGGLNILMLGVIGEYIWRIYDEVKKKPSFIIDSIIQ